MKKVVFLIAMAMLIGIALPSSPPSAQVRRVAPEKWNKLTPEQKKRYIEMGKEAQRAAEGSMNDYNEVGDSADPDKVKKKLDDAIKDTFRPKVRCPNCGDGIRG